MTNDFIKFVGFFFKVLLNLVHELYSPLFVVSGKKKGPGNPGLRLSLLVNGDTRAPDSLMYVVPEERESYSS
jgi:hypothetical protein